MRIGILCALLLAGVAVDVSAQVTDAASDRVVVVGNSAQPVMWNHRASIQDAILKAQPNGTVVIPSSYTGTDCNPVATCNPGNVIVIDWRTAPGNGSGLPSGCTGSTGAISCNSSGVAYNAPNGGIAANYIQGNSNTLPNRISIGDNASQCSLIAGAFNFCPILGVMHVFDETGADLGSLLNVINLGAPNGVASLDNSTLIPTAQEGTGTANSTVFLRGDRTWGTPNAFANAFQAPNNALSGTTLNQLASPSLFTPGQVTNAPSGFGVIGPVSAGAGNAGNATIQFFGSALCVFDGATTNGDYVVASATVPGDCHDAGNNLANVGVQQLLGISLASNVGAGTYSVWFVPLVGRHVVAQGTTAMASGTVITTATCATVVTATATGASATTDNLSADFSADPTSTTGYSPSAAGILTIIKFITANTVNFKVCNNTGSNITPGAVTLKWSVWR